MKPKEGKKVSIPIFMDSFAEETTAGNGKGSANSWIFIIIPPKGSMNSVLRQNGEPRSLNPAKVTVKSKKKPQGATKRGPKSLNQRIKEGLGEY